MSRMFMLTVLWLRDTPLSSKVCGGIPLFPLLHVCGFQWPIGLSHQPSLDTKKNPQPSWKPPQANRGPIQTCRGTRPPKTRPFAAAPLLASSPAADSLGTLPLWRSPRLLLLLHSVQTRCSWLLRSEARRAGSAWRTCGLHAWVCVRFCLHNAPHKPSGLRLSLAPSQKKKRMIPFISSVLTEQVRHILCKWRQIGWQLRSMEQKHALSTNSSVVG